VRYDSGMRFEDFDAEIPPLEVAWDSWFLESESLDSFLSLESGLANGIMLDSIASVGMSSWVDVQRSLGSNIAYGVQLAGGVADTFIAAGKAQWNIGQGGVVSGIFGGLPNGEEALSEALGAFNGQGVNADALAGALGKAALGVALGVVSAALPVVGAVAGLVAGAVTLIIREYRKAEGDDFTIAQNYLPTSSATAALCRPGTANAADRMMLTVIRGQIPAFASVGGVRGIPDTTGQVETAARLTELTDVFLPDVIPSGRTSPEVKFADLEDYSLIAGKTKHPRAPGDKYVYAGLTDSATKEGDLYVIQDQCTDARRAFIRVGIARDFGSVGTGWIPGRGAFSGPAYWVGRVGVQRGKAAGGPGTASANSSRELPWPHEKIGLGPNVQSEGNGWVSAAEMFPASSAFMASLERQVMSAPGCFLVSPLEILLFWRQWQSGFQELGERFVWEGEQLPESFNRPYFVQAGPTSYLCQPHGPNTCFGSGNPADGKPRPGQENTFVLSSGTDVASFRAASFFRQAACWKIKRGGNWVVESAAPGKLDSIAWQDGTPFGAYPTLMGGGGRIAGTLKNVVPQKIYAFRDPSGQATDKGTTG